MAIPKHLGGTGLSDEEKFKVTRDLMDIVHSFIDSIGSDSRKLALKDLSDLSDFAREHAQEISGEAAER